MRGSGLQGGGYVLFVDSDDVIHRDILEKCVQKIKEERTDAVVFGVSMNIVDDNGDVIAKTPMIPNSERYRCRTAREVILGPLRYMYGVPYEDLEKVLYGDRYRYSQFVWVYCWLYRRKILLDHHLFFREDITVREDGLFNYEYLSHIDSVDCVEEIGYEYYKRSDGAASTLHRNVRIENKIGIAKYRHTVSEFVRERTGLDISDWANGSYALSCIQLALSQASIKGGYKKYREYVRLEDVRRAIKHVPLRGKPKTVLPLALAKMGCYRILFLCCKVFGKFVKV